MFYVEVLVPFSTPHYTYRAGGRACLGIPTYREARKKGYVRRFLVPNKRFGTVYWHAATPDGRMIEPGRPLPRSKPKNQPRGAYVGPPRGCKKYRAARCGQPRPE